MRIHKVLLVITVVVTVPAFGALIFYVAFALGRVSTVPGSTDFWKTFGPPIATFAAAIATVCIGLVAFFGAVYSTYHLAKSNEATRKQTAADNKATREQTATDNKATREQTATDNEATRRQTARDNEATRRQTAADNEATRKQTSRDNEATRRQTSADNRDARRQTATDNEASRRQTARDEELARCWDRFTWLVDRLGGTSADNAQVATAPSLFPADVVVEIAISLEADADRLEDESLRTAVRLYQQSLGEQFEF
ncbi:hypothetical protein HGA11_05310 [Mycolicibacterium septicum DSM 44393]|uniref:Uncharacterized protein n=1 Tax=Mycolicibacterium septicum DSM 44393 TaxID=1341646 RepID=A0A7X6RUH9_9MYCO|nr:hypothetical protein [Mycolicibacterium septicum]NKZ10389.1 hypothetical protein [Mycolicibacterium septicum DSM 44393]